MGWERPKGLQLESCNTLMQRKSNSETRYDPKHIERQREQSNRSMAEEGKADAQLFAFESPPTGFVFSSILITTCFDLA